MAEVSKELEAAARAAGDALDRLGDGVVNDDEWREAWDWWLRYKDDPTSLSARYSRPQMLHDVAHAVLATVLREPSDDLVRAILSDQLRPSTTVRDTLKSAARHMLGDASLLPAQPAATAHADPGDPAPGDERSPTGGCDG